MSTTRRVLAALTVLAAAALAPAAATASDSTAAGPLVCQGGAKYRVTVISVEPVTIYDSPTGGNSLGRLGFGTQFCNYAGTHGRYLVHSNPGWWLDRGGLEWGSGTSGNLTTISVATFNNFDGCLNAAQTWWFNGGYGSCTDKYLTTQVPH